MSITPALQAAIEEWREQGRAEVRAVVEKWAGDVVDALPEEYTPQAHATVCLIRDLRAALATETSEES